MVARVGTCDWCGNGYYQPPTVSNKRFCSTTCKRKYGTEQRRLKGFMNELKRKNSYGDPELLAAMRRWK